MAETGSMQKLQVLHEGDNGWVLSDSAGTKAMLPFRPGLGKIAPGDLVEVFLYLGKNGEKTATTHRPKLFPGQFGLLQVVDVAEGVGAFMDWGIEKDLMVPFKEQPEKMEAGKWYVVCVDIDGDSGRLYGSARLSKFLSNDTLTVKEGEEVDLLVWKETELGFPVIVNNTHHGLVYRDEIFKPFRVGDKTKGYVKTIREQNKLDIALEPIGYHNFNDANATFIYRMLEENDGFLDVNDKSDPEEIHARFRMSKKAFKKAVGALYKAQKIVIREEGIRLL